MPLRTLPLPLSYDRTHPLNAVPQRNGLVEMIRLTDRLSVDRGNQAMTAEAVPCVACRADAPKRLFTETYVLEGQRCQLGVNRCTICSQVYVSPRLDEPSTARVYEVDRDRTISHQYCWAGVTSDERFRPLLSRLASRAPAGSLLDVGCGNGSFLAAAERLGRWKLTGIEPVPSAATAARSRVKAEVISATLEDSGLTDSSFDVVTMLGVLEHLHDPMGALRCARACVKPNGWLAIYVPNFHYLRLKDTGVGCWLRNGSWSNLSPQEHLSHFTPNSLVRLLDRAGYRVERVDIGRPFMTSSRLRRWLKATAYATTVALHRVTGIHLGGIEVLARASKRSH